MCRFDPIIQEPEGNILLHRGPKQLVVRVLENDTDAAPQSFQPGAGIVDRLSQNQEFALLRAQGSIDQ